MSEPVFETNICTKSQPESGLAIGSPLLNPDSETELGRHIRNSHSEPEVGTRTRGAGGGQAFETRNRQHVPGTGRWNPQLVSSFKHRIRKCNSNLIHEPGRGARCLETLPGTQRWYAAWDLIQNRTRVPEV